MAGVLIQTGCSRDGCSKSPIGLGSHRMVSGDIRRDHSSTGRKYNSCRRVRITYARLRDTQTEELWRRCCRQNGSTSDMMALQTWPVLDDKQTLDDGMRD